MVDAKTQKPSVCNALETLLVHEAVAEEFLPRVAAALVLEADDPTTLRGLYRWTAERLASHKMPTHWFLLDKIPKTIPQRLFTTKWLQVIKSKCMWLPRAVAQKTNRRW